MKSQNFFVILHNIRSCYNVGSIFRSADAFGVNKIFLSGYTPTPETNPKEIAKTALGAEQWIAWEKIWRTSDLIKKLQQQGMNVIALEQAKGSERLNNFQPQFPLALVLGNEVRGLSRTILKKVDQIVEIPMKGKKESLNVSVAFGISAYVASLKLKDKN